MVKSPQLITKFLYKCTPFYDFIAFSFLPIIFQLLCSYYIKSIQIDNFFFEIINILFVITSH